ncbi:MAG: DUF3326 domain-containing protein [Planctomycetota bacterium]
MKIFETHHPGVDIGRLVDDPATVLADLVPDGRNAVRMVVEQDGLALAHAPTGTAANIGSFRQRDFENEAAFNVVFAVPTGVGAQTGGHAGDANPTLMMLAGVADHVFTHPNVCNASDINELPVNSSYIEGSVLSRFMMGDVALARARNNRCLVLVARHRVDRFVTTTINAVNAAVSSYGFDPVKVVVFEDCEMEVEFSQSGRASGVVHRIEELKEIVDAHEGQFDAIAVCSAIKHDRAMLDAYYLDREGAQVNPLGGIEALLSHWLSLYTNRPVAHCPMMEDEDIELADYGITDPRLAAEMVSVTFAQCIFKGLQRAPRIVPPRTRDAFAAEDINALVMPQGCFGLPIIAALKQGIPVIAVRERLNSRGFRGLVRDLPWARGQYVEVENYFEAAGHLACLKAGVSPRSVRRPLDVSDVLDESRGGRTTDADRQYAAGG